MLAKPGYTDRRQGALVAVLWLLEEFTVDVLAAMNETLTPSAIRRSPQVALFHACDTAQFGYPRATLIQMGHAEMGHGDQMNLD